MCTGLMVKRVKAGKRFTTITYTLDTRTLRELRALERMAAKLCDRRQEEQTSAPCETISLEALEQCPVSLTLRRSPAAPVLPDLPAPLVRAADLRRAA